MDRYAHVYKGSPPNHCCCDQALRVLPNGEWIIVFMTGGKHEPERENFVAIVRSADEGRSWSAPEIVHKRDDRGVTLTEVQLHDGVITVYLNIHFGFFDDWNNYTITSADNGRSWNEPVPFDPVPRRAFIRNLYKSTWGEWFMPVETFDTMPDPTPSPLKDGSFQRTLNGALISSDQGRTWEMSNLVGPTAGWAENDVVELSDKRLVMLIRADGTGHLVRSESADQGRTWSQPVPTDIPNPGSKFNLHRLSDGRILIIHNPNPQPGWNNRNPMAIWISGDDMQTWGYKRNLTDFPGTHSYPDGFVSRDERYVHFAYDYNRHDVIYWGAELPQ